MAKNTVSDRIIAVIALSSSIVLVSSICLIVYLEHRKRRRRRQLDVESQGSDTPPVKFDDRKQTHADPKVFSWLGKVDADADRKGIFRTSVHADRVSVWELSEDEMKNLDEALERLRGRDSVISAGRISLVGNGRASLASR